MCMIKVLWALRVKIFIVANYIIVETYLSFQATRVMKVPVENKKIQDYSSFRSLQKLQKEMLNILFENIYIIDQTKRMSFFSLKQNALILVQRWISSGMVFQISIPLCFIIFAEKRDNIWWLCLWCIKKYIREKEYPFSVWSKRT